MQPSWCYVCITQSLSSLLETLPLWNLCGAPVLHLRQLTLIVGVGGWWLAFVLQVVEKPKKHHVHERVKLTVEHIWQ